MSEQAPTGNYISLKDHIKDLMGEHASAHGREHGYLQEAVEKAERLLDSKVSAVEGKHAEQLKGLANEMKILTDRVVAVEKEQGAQKSRSGGSAQTIVWIFAGLSALATIVGLISLFTRGN